MEYAVRCVLGIELKSTDQVTAANAAGNLRAHVEETLRELEHRWVSKTAVELDPVSAEASFVVVVEAGDQDRATSKAWGVLSMAVHAAGGATSHRPFPRDAGWSVRLIRADARPWAKEDKTAAFA
ncbi:MAG: hypothetical protein ABSD85_07910 [Acidimicrobiales bacterium]|jgi:hypothetical protein